MKRLGIDERSSPSRLVRAGFVLGGVIVTGACAWYALTGTGRVALSSGWVIPAIGLLQLVQQAGCGCAWHALVERPRPSRRYFVWMRWIRSSVAALVPVSGVGAALIAVRLSIRGGIEMGMAGASLTLDATVEMITQIAFTAIGIGLLLAHTSDPHMLGWSLCGLSLAVLAVALFIAAQRWGGLRLVELGLRRLAKRWPIPSRLAEAKLHDPLLRLYRNRRAAAVAASYHLGAWLLGAGEVWLVLFAIGHPLSLADCMIVESLSMAARSAGFFVPGGLGVQEGGLVMAGGLVGLSPETAIAIAVLKRLRDVAIGVPGLLTWLWAEGRHPPADARVKGIQSLL
ncbi:MAG TPA: lysylphosphatidylglycerol synthase domain-containing protein [Stellaceae bacterium]|nr:lysylphosphatidylglycerol synthase domain-containing protein [Stellaceae bacterium]